MVAEDIAIGNSTSLIWNIPILTDGDYKMRITPDKKETFYLSNERPETPVCFEDGETMPGVSAVFRVANVREIAGYKDRYGPLGSNGRVFGISWSFVLSVLALASYL